MQPWKALAFLAVSALLLYVSRHSISRRGSHGFYRFFAWEFIAALWLLNVSYWFENWHAWYQIISWMLLFGSLIPLLLGIRTLRRSGKPDRQLRAEPGLLAFERTTLLVTHGIYRYIRHPLYSSLLLLDWGIFFKKPSLLGFALALCASLFLVMTARADETECIQTFGTEYRDYMQHTRMFLPYII